MVPALFVLLANRDSSTLVRPFVRLLPLGAGLIAAVIALMPPQPLLAHGGYEGTLVSAAAMNGLIADEVLCGPGGYRIEETELCTHGPDSSPQGDGEVAMAGANLAPIICEGDGVSGKRVQVLYVRTESAPERYAQYLSSFRAWAAEADAIYNESAQITGGQRRIRFVTNDTCEIDIPVVVLPDGSDGSFASTISALRTLGYNHPNRKYLLFMESSVYCGIASVVNDHRPGSENRSNHIAGYARVDNGCWEGVTVAHELTHTLGGIQHTAPNASGGWHCVDENDIMCYSDAPYYPALHFACPSTHFNHLLDCNNDDYFHTDPPAGSYLATHWNVANSAFLIAGPPLPTRPELALTTQSGATQVTVFTPVELVIETPVTAAANRTTSDVQQVEFSLNDEWIATVTSEPYRYTWQATVAGEYTFTARIQWSDGDTVTLTPLVITVLPDNLFDAPPDDDGQHALLLPLIMS
ncbi:MAG: hypothetical protein DCC55_27490 [Chloroflexi bacterium]|nr:MAG: hypothetical protein DCC55_27490 [Chloroflexota bacterium]